MTTSLTMAPSLLHFEFYILTHSLEKLARTRKLAILWKVNNDTEEYMVLLLSPGIGKERGSHFIHSGVHKSYFPDLVVQTIVLSVMTFVSFYACFSYNLLWQVALKLIMKS